MKTRIFTLIIGIFVITNVFSQKKLNNYKYIIVPEQFGFLNEKDQHQLNSLSVFLFNKYGFTAIIEGGDYPEDLSNNRCLALDSDVIKAPGLFKTKLSILLKDCKGQVVYTSKEGLSMEKDYKKGYTEALRNAFKNLKVLNYKYEPMQTGAKPTFVSKPIPSKPQKIIKKKELVSGDKNSSSVLYAQAIDNGFQLVDSSPKVVYLIKNTSLENVFIVENKNAIIFKKEDQWFLEYYSTNTLQQQKLNIKF